MIQLIIYFLLSVAVSFVCSLSEAVLLSISHAQVALMVEQGRASGRILQFFKEKIDRPLAAILTLNTVAATAGATAVATQALILFGSQYVALFSGLLTICILVLAEITPKTLGVVYCKQLAPLVAYLTKGLVFSTYPVVLLIELWGRVIADPHPLVKFPREEMLIAAEIGGEEGQLLDQEKRVIKNLLLLNRMQVRDILTPRSVLFALPESQTVDGTICEYRLLRFSRIPVYGQGLDDIVGLVRRDQIYQAYSQGQVNLKLGSLANPIHVVPFTKSVAKVLYEFIKLREHLFLVVDEYGGTAGIITLEDAIETLLGVEIVDELDSVVDMQAFAREQWEKRKKSQLS